MYIYFNPHHRISSESIRKKSHFIWIRIWGEPIVCTPEHAYRCFMATNMDVLVVGRFLLLKESQPKTVQVDTQEYLQSFSLD